MITARTTGELPSSPVGFCAALGFFDGVHLGHQEIIRQTVADARQLGASSVVVTFENHPSTVVAPHRVPPLIYPLPRKLRALDELSVDAVLLLPFDYELSRQSGDVFIRNLAARLSALRSLCVGENFVFGRDRSGNVALLRELGQELGFSVHGIARVLRNGTPVSSTRIRRAILDGHLEAASQLLGRPYSVTGTVVVGDAIGRTLGFPTANLETRGLALPPNGVYLAQTTVGNSSFPAVLNIGHRPTVRSGSSLRFEVHLLDFEGELYGHELEVFVGTKLRDERSFPSREALSEQIGADIVRARQLIG